MFELKGRSEVKALSGMRVGEGLLSFCKKFFVYSLYGSVMSCVGNEGQTRDYFDATASNWNTSAHSALWRVALYKDWQ